MKPDAAGSTCPWVEEPSGSGHDGASVRIAIAGKGGSGKTTIAGTLARMLAQRGRRVLAVDADTNPNLSTTLGVPSDRATRITSLPRSLMERQTQADGTVKPVFVADPVEVLAQYGADAPDGVRLLVMGAVGHGGAG
ncbi:MAG: nucleotide-binding protein [Acidobacteriota bacterium]